jgi:tetratricopeptide (TPR) repeat protein
MKKNAFLISMVLVTSLVVVVGAQTRKTTKKKTPTATSETSTPTAPQADTSKTRSRRAGTTNEPQPGSSPAETEEPKTEPKPEAESTAVPLTATVAPGETEPKKEEKPDEQADDPLAGLRNEISAAESGPGRIRLQLKLVEELVAAGNKTDALKELRSITNTDVFDPTGFYNTGNSFARLNDIEGAIEAYRKAIEQRKGRYSRAYNNMGVVLLRAGRWEEAYAAFNSALKLEIFRYPEASYNLGRLYAARGQNDLAIREWQRALALNPEHTAARDALARAGLNDRVEVKTVKASTRNNSDRTLEPLSPVTPAASEKTVGARSATVRGAKALVIDPASFRFLQRARTSTEKGNTLDAIDNYKRLIKREGGYFAPANLELSFALLSLNRYDEALENLQMVSGRDGLRYPISYYHLARVYEMKGELKLAEESFGKASAAFGSENSQFLLDLSRVREKQGDFNGALLAMEQYVESMKKHGQEPSWSEERLTALRAKQSGSPKE